MEYIIIVVVIYIYAACAVLLVHVLRRTHEPFVTHRDASIEKRQHVRARGEKKIAHSSDIPLLGALSLSVGQDTLELDCTWNLDA